MRGCGAGPLPQLPPDASRQVSYSGLILANRAEQQSRSRACIMNSHLCSSLWFMGDSRLSRAQASCSDGCGRAVKCSVSGYSTSCTLRPQRNYSPCNIKQNNCFIVYAAKYSTPSSRIDGTHSGPAIRTITFHGFSDKSYPYTKIQFSPSRHKAIRLGR